MSVTIERTRDGEICSACEHKPEPVHAVISLHASNDHDGATMNLCAEHSRDLLIGHAFIHSAIMGVTIPKALGLTVPRKRKAKR